MYEELVNQGWRRNGLDVYLNCCPGCNRCVPIRIPVLHLDLTKSQRRTRSRNADLRLSLHDPAPTGERTALYERYQLARHPNYSARDPAELSAHFDEFFCKSRVETRFMEYRSIDGILVGLGIVDLLPDSVSSVYFIFDPTESKRRLGIFSILCEADLALSSGRSYLHLGFWVPGSPRMEYKAEFYPHEVLTNQGWVRRGRPSDALPMPQPWNGIPGLRA